MTGRTPAAAKSVSPPGPAVAAAEEQAPFSERHPQVARLIMVAVWLYVAALWLLALDQIFNWGIFGPKLPPT